MTWLGMLPGLDLARFVLPARLRKLVFQPASLEFKLTRKEVKVCRNGFFMKDGQAQIFAKVITRLHS